jgi:hypothetical protein
MLPAVAGQPPQPGILRPRPGAAPCVPLALRLPWSCLPWSCLPWSCLPLIQPHLSLPIDSSLVTTNFRRADSRTDPGGRIYSLPSRAVIAEDVQTPAGVLLVILQIAAVR